MKTVLSALYQALVKIESRIVLPKEAPLWAWLIVFRYSKSLWKISGWMLQAIAYLEKD